MRIATVLTLLVALSACNRGVQDKDAVRQGVMDYLASRPNLSMGGMSVEVKEVDFKGDKAEANVSFTPKGGPAGNGMTMRYSLEKKEGKWVVTGKADSGKNPHGGSGAITPSPEMPSPHGGSMGSGMGGIDTEKPAPPAPAKK